MKGFLQVTANSIAVHIELPLMLLGAKVFIAQAVEEYLREAGIQ